MFDDNDKLYMSDELLGRVNLNNQPDISEIERNTMIVAVQSANSNDVLIGGMRYFRREDSVTAIEVNCSLGSAMSMIRAFESGNKEIGMVELHQGNELVIHVEYLTVDGYYVSDVDPMTGQVLFGLKLSEKKPSVL